jgi:hypothetical protein
MRSTNTRNILQTCHRYPLCWRFIKLYGGKIFIPYINSNPSAKVGTGICRMYIWEIKHFIDFYIDDLPSPSAIPSELRLWKKTCELMNIKPETVAGVLKICCKTDFTNIFIILKIIATLSVTSCECERSNSELSLLKTYLRTTMGQSRLNGLALMHVHYSLELNMKKIIDSFARKHLRRMMLNDIINDSLLN